MPVCFGTLENFITRAPPPLNWIPISGPIGFALISCTRSDLGAAINASDANTRFCLFGVKIGAVRGTAPPPRYTFTRRPRRARKRFNLLRRSTSAHRAQRSVCRPRQKINLYYFCHVLCAYINQPQPPPPPLQLLNNNENVA